MARADYERHLTAADRISREIGLLSDDADLLARDVDGLIERGAVLGDLDDASRGALVDARRTERALGQRDRALNAAGREVRALQAEEARLSRNAARAEDRAGQAAVKQAATSDELAALIAEYDGLRGQWDRALRQSRQLPRGQNTIDLPPTAGLSGASVPPAISQASVAAITLSSMRPMRPAQPTTPTR